MNDDADQGLTPTEPSASNPPSAASIPDGAVVALTQWAKERKKWLETLVFQATNLRRNLSEGELATVYEMLQVECGLKTTEATAAPSTHSSVRPIVSFSTLSLKELSKVENVNALARGQRLIFHEKLTIFFGENGCGKSGYARVIKRMAGARGAEELIPNILESSPGLPSAEMSFHLDQMEGKVTWSNQLGIEPLLGVQVFDGRAASIHLDDDLTYAYTPRELDSFDYVQNGLERVHDKLEAATAERRNAVTGYINALKPGSVIFGIATDDRIGDRVANATTLARLSEKESADLEALPRDIQALQSGSVAAEIQLRRQKSRLLNSLADQLESFTGFSAEQYFRSLIELRQSVELETRVTSDAFSGLGIPKLLEPSWRKFILAAEEYIRDANADAPYPTAGGECVYCRQPLQLEAVELLVKYKDFCNSSAQDAISRARRDLATVGAPFIQFNTAAIAEVQALLQTDDDATLHRAVAAFDNLQILRGAILRNEQAQFTDAIAKATELGAEIHLRVKDVDQTISDLSQQEIDRQSILGSKSQRLSQLRERSLLTDLIPQLRAYGQNLTLMTLAEAELSNFTSYRKSLTGTAKDASEKLLNETFQKQFAEECKRLRAPDVKLVFPGRLGKVIRQKTVGASHKLSSILSEGEQKVIALADFLAELSLRPQRVSVVFDDPVTSLDYKRIEEVSQRLCALSERCQVVIFTHNLFLVSHLMKGMGKGFSYYDIRRNLSPGFVSVGTSPRIDTFTKIKVRVTAAIREATQLSNAEEQRKAVEVIYDHIRSACEVLVEQELLLKLSERFLPNLKMTAIAKIKYNKLEAAATTALEVFERACRFIPAHSQPLETLSIAPTLQEAEDDWKKLVAAKTLYDS